MNSRWWENYLVRYFIGTPVGCVIVVALAHAMLHDRPGYSAFLAELPGLLGSSTEKGVPTSLMVGVVLAGMCFCYISSAPITVFHACRMLRGGNAFGIAPATMWSWWLLCGLGLLLGGATSYASRGDPTTALRPTSAAIWLAIPAVYVMFSQMSQVAELLADQYDAVNSRSRTVSAILGVLGLLHRSKRSADAPVTRGAFRCGEFENFYIELAKQRESTPVQGFRDSYAHLREHSNSVFIVLCELSFGAVLWLLIGLQPDPSGRVAATVVATTLWLTPNVYLWGQANRLEEALRSGRLPLPQVTRPAQEASRAQDVTAPAAERNPQ